MLLEEGLEIFNNCDRTGELKCSICALSTHVGSTSLCQDIKALKMKMFSIILPKERHRGEYGEDLCNIHPFCFDCLNHSKCSEG